MAVSRSRLSRRGRVCPLDRGTHGWDIQESGFQNGTSWGGELESWWRHWGDIKLLNYSKEVHFVQTTVSARYIQAAWHQYSNDVSISWFRNWIYHELSLNFMLIWVRISYLKSCILENKCQKKSSSNWYSEQYWAIYNTLGTNLNHFWTLINWRTAIFCFYCSSVIKNGCRFSLFCSFF